MAVSGEARKRLWGRSGNRCAKCRKELVRPDSGGLRGALVGEEAHIIAKAPGGARYEPLHAKARDGYANLILLCANDHIEVDAGPDFYSVERLRTMKVQHEMWVSSRLSVDARGVEAEGTLATVMLSGEDLWLLFDGVLGYQIGRPPRLAQENEDRIDRAAQVFTDWCDISSDVVAQGFRATREAQRSLTGELTDLAKSGFLVLAGQRQATLAGGALTGPCLVLQIVRREELEALSVSSPALED